MQMAKYTALNVRWYWTNDTAYARQTVQRKNGRSSNMVTMYEKVTVTRDDPAFELYEASFTAEAGWKREENTDSVTYSREKFFSLEVKV